MILRSNREVGPRLRKARLTSHNLKKFEQEMGKNRKINGSESGLGTETSSIKTKNTMITDKKFGERLWENEVRFEHHYAQPPKDLAAVKQYLDKDRESQSANEDDYQDYLCEITQAENEDTVTTNV